MAHQIIFHIDMDAFFASCEEAINPSLNDKPLIVGGTKKDTRSIVACPNYLARAKGIRTAMPLSKAMQLAPDGNFIRSTKGLYSDYSKRVREIFIKYTPLVEPVSIDEAYLEVSEVLSAWKGDYLKLANAIKEDIKETLHITCSIGISRNKVCSKIASRINKPDGVTLVPFENEKEFLADLPVEKIPGVGKSTLKKLNKYNIFFIKDLLKFPKEFYDESLGIHSRYLLNVANGIDNRKVNLISDYEQKSLSNENTLSFDTSNKEFLYKELYYLLEKSCSRLRKKSLKSKCLTVKVKYSDFTVNQKSHTTQKYSNLEIDFYSDCITLLNMLFRRNKKIRLVGVKFSELIEDSSYQEEIFTDEDKYSNLMTNIDKLRKKYKYDAITFGKTFEKKKR
jgi:DNA polymerase IV